MPLAGDVYRSIYSRRISSKSRGFPSLLNLETCNICNIRCTMCPNSAMTRPKSTMSMSPYQKIIDDAARIGIKEVSLLGWGEPLLDKLIFDRIEYAKWRGLTVRFNSNGTLLLDNDNIASLVKSNLDCIYLSIDGVTKETYEKIRLGAKFEDVVNGFGRLIEEKKRQNATTPEVRISCCVQVGNYTEIAHKREEYYELFRDADLLVFVPVLKLQNEGEHLPTDLDFKTPVKRRGHIYPCHNLFDVFNVFVDGSVVLCCLDYDAQVRLGDLNVQTITEVWESTQYENIRRLHLQGNGGKMKMCSNCSEFIKSSFSWWF
ncbi:radical SAM/SPASM domain-containing protein [Chloroflexota bacterium]